MTSYEIVPVTTDIDQDAETQNAIDQFMDTVDTDYLAQFGYTKDQVLAENDVDFSTQKDLENIHEEHNLGDIMSDAYVYWRWKMQQILTVSRWMWQLFQVALSVTPMQKAILPWSRYLIHFPRTQGRRSAWISAHQCVSDGKRVKDSSRDRCIRF